LQQSRSELTSEVYETLNVTRCNQKGGGRHTKQSYIAMVLEQIEIYGIFGEASANFKQWMVPKVIYEALER
jgi:hypothetical protein